MAEIARENDFFPPRALRLCGEAFVFDSGLSGLGITNYECPFQTLTGVKSGYLYGQ